MMKPFDLQSNYIPKGDQPKAIQQLVDGVNQGHDCQTVLGVTGSGKTFTMANVIQRLQRPALVLAPNKTLAAQLYAEMKSFFPNNAVEYFVSYYDYYQPEAYMPTTDTFIEKDASINEHIEQMRLSATKSIVERSDTIIVASVSAIYGLGDPTSYADMVLELSVHARMTQSSVIARLVELQYTRNDIDFQRGQFRVRGDIIDIFPAESEKDALRVSLFDDEIEQLTWVDPVTGKTSQSLSSYTIFPKTHYVTPKEKIQAMIQHIETEMQKTVVSFRQNDQLLEAQRIEQRTKFDIEMMQELGYCSGIENYSRYLSGRKEGQQPPTLMDYLPGNALLFVDESHVTIPQVGGMYYGDRARKENLVNYGFRLPSALDNRPLKFEEFEQFVYDTILISATPGDYERKRSTQIIELVVRPTGLIDPEVKVRPVSNQVDDLLGEIKKRVAKQQRVLVTTLTKKMSEHLTEYYADMGIKVRYLHSDIDAVERVEILRDLRLGVFDVLVGINLLREGLDLPEVSLVGILDADKAGFLRSTRSLIQTIGRAARHVEGTAILYADRHTEAMNEAIGETQRRRLIQIDYNQTHGITPMSIQKPIQDQLNDAKKDEDQKNTKTTKEVHSMSDVTRQIKSLEKQMHQAAKALDFETAASLRDEVLALEQQWFKT